VSLPTFPLVDHDDRWRPAQRKGPVCGYTFRGVRCDKRRGHYCEPRADRAVAFFAEVLVHTKGRFARKPFVLSDWQEHEIVRPLFGEVTWSEEWDCYARRFRIAYIVLGRKNGKSELVAGIVLLLLIGDDEEAAEVYGAARDTKQAGKVAEVVNRMRQLSPLLNGDRDGRLSYNKNSRRIFDERTASYFEVITADALGELGHNPHGSYIDEVLSQRDGSLFSSLRTSMGARHQPMLALVTTETNNPAGFGASEIDEAERIQEDASRAPHIFAYVRKMPENDNQLARLHKLFPGHPDLPVSTDAFDEANWKWPNPALDEFLSRQSLRDEAIEAHNEPSKLNSFLQYRMNRRVAQVSRWMPLDLWQGATGDTGLWMQTAVDEMLDRLAHRPCFAGLDLASTTDLASWMLWFPPHEGETGRAFWWYFTPQAQLSFLDRHTAGAASNWAKQGWLTASEGDWIDYEGSIHPLIENHAQRFRIQMVGYDQKEATATAQFMQTLGLDISPVYQGCPGR